MCLPSDALLQHLPSYLGFSYLGRGVSLLGFSSKAQPLLLTLDEGYLLIAALPDLQYGIAPLGPPAHAQPRPGLSSPPLGSLVGCSSWLPPLASGLGAWGSSSRPLPLASGLGAWGSSSRPPPLTLEAGYLLLAAPPDLGRRVAPLGRSCTVEYIYTNYRCMLSCSVVFNSLLSYGL